MNTIAIRAINPDNDKELRSLIKLFSRVYPAGYPTNCVYDLEFWRMHCGRTFTSLAAFSGSNMIAHIGLKPGQIFENSMELLLPVFDTPTLNDMYLVAEAGNRTILGLAERQNWQSLYCLPFTESVEYLPVLTDVMGFSEAVLLPARNGRGRNEVPAFWWKSLSKETTARPFYVPAALTEILPGLVKELNLSGRHLVFDTSVPVRPNIIATERFRLGAPGVEVQKMDILSSNIAPRCLFPNKEPAYVSVHASAPSAVTIVDTLIDRGFVFSGLVPECCGHDQIILTNAALSDQFMEERFSLSGKRIAAALQQQYIKGRQGGGRITSVATVPEGIYPEPEPLSSAAG